MQFELSHSWRIAELGQVPISRADSDGRRNTIQPIDSTMLPSKKHLFGCTRSNPSQGSVLADLTIASDFAIRFQCYAGLCLLLRRPVETTTNRDLSRWLAITSWLPTSGQLEANTFQYTWWCKCLVV